MNVFRRAAALLLLVALLLTAGGVGAQTALPVDETGAPIVARVNGQAITLAAFERALARSGSPEASDPDAVVLRSAVLETMIDQLLIVQAATAGGLTVDDAALDAELASYVEAVGGAEAWANWLAENGYTEAEFRATLRESLLTNLVRDVVTSGLNGAQPHVHARHILVATEAEARAVLARLQAGERFEALAAALSLDVTTQARGGDLGWFVEDELLDPALARLAFTLPINGIAGPIETRLGFHILQTLERADMPIPPEKLAVVAQLRFENWLDNLAARSTIERYLN
jgi:parvulin-like peptidyl-prolyl isomerase